MGQTITHLFLNFMKAMMTSVVSLSNFSEDMVPKLEIE